MKLLVFFFMADRCTVHHASTTIITKTKHRHEMCMGMYVSTLRRWRRNSPYSRLSNKCGKRKQTESYEETLETLPTCTTTAVLFACCTYLYRSRVRSCLTVATPGRHGKYGSNKYQGTHVRGKTAIDSKGCGCAH